jgi:energy-coupling factor transporter ATP-binding protein EcfA2
VIDTSDKEKKKRQSKQKLRFNDGEHWFIVGKTGMGKTHLIKRIIKKKLEIQPFLNVYHVDTKKRGDFSSQDGSLILSEIAPRAFTTQGNRMVWQPLVDDIEEYSKFFLGILNAGLPAIVNIDESINMKFNDRIPRGLSILLAQGRLPGIHVIGGTQEVARAPRQMLSQASHIISFNVINDYDERMMLKYLRLKEEKTLNLRKYQFRYLRPDIDDTAMFMNDVSQLLPMVA